MSILEIKERRIRNITILDLTGNLRIGEESVSLRAVITQLLKEGKTQILLNLAQVNYIDSSGLGELIAGYISLSRAGGEMKLLRLTQKVTELMTITKLLTVFDVHETEAAAVNSFAENQRRPFSVAQVSASVEQSARQ